MMDTVEQEKLSSGKITEGSESLVMVVRGVKAAEKSSFPVSQLDRISHMSSSRPCIIRNAFAFVYGNKGDT
jgi:hypothetical protein